MKCAIVVCLVMLPSVLFAFGTGDISGTVTDSLTGDPVGYANVILLGTPLGAMTDTSGSFLIAGVPEGIYTVKVMMMGYTQRMLPGVKVKADSTTALNVMLTGAVVNAFEEVVITKKRPLIQSRSFAAFSCPNPQTRVLHFRGGRQGVVVGKGCRRGAVVFNTEEYSRIVETDFLDAIRHPFSTFAADVDPASYANVRRFIMHDQLPPVDAVRTEEFVNYFDYNYPEPAEGKPLSISVEYSECPWDKTDRLVHVGIRGKRPEDKGSKPSNLVFLIDVSGSMEPADKLPLLKRAFRMLVKQLAPEDQISIVVFNTRAWMLLPSTPGSEKKTIAECIDALSAGGSTAGGAGIELAYEEAKENFIKGGNNRVILATDGDFNTGVSSTSELVRFIEKQRDEGIFFSVLGFGMGNYKDNRLQELADRGNGSHAYIDNILEAKKVLVSELRATLFTIAKDVKIQVEFNPAQVRSYRLIGYENRRLPDEDFEDDTKDAGEIGAGHTVTALYEIVPAGDRGVSPGTYKTKYVETVIKKAAAETDEVLTVRIRYKEPDGGVSKELSAILRGKPKKLSETSDSFRFSAAVAEFAMLLRDSQYKGDATLDGIKKLAKASCGEDPFGYRAEFMSLLERVGILMEE